MEDKDGDTGLRLTRREVLRDTARGAAALAVSPWLGRAEFMLAEETSEPRTRETFDFDWRFTRGDPPGAQGADFNDRAWRAVDLPHDWSIEGPYSEDEPASGPGGYLPTGIGWYRKRFSLAAAERGRVVTLEFDGVYQNSEVWINGRSLGVRPYGFVPFAYELTPYLRFGSENVVAVRVDNSLQTNCRWYTGSGINRHTWLLKTDALRVAYRGIFVSTPRVAADHALVRVETEVVNGTEHAANCTLSAVLLDASNGHLETTHSLAAGATFRFVQELQVQDPLLWSVDHPYLYTVRVTLREGTRVVDVDDTPVGIREAVFDVNRGFLLNGVHVKLNGCCLHQEAGSVGSAVPERMWQRRLELLRSMGCNAIRTSHNPYPAEFLDLCDRMGFLVMNEAFDEWRVPKGQIQHGYHEHFDAWHERDLKDFIRRDRNHPSVVLWSAGNEVPDQSAPDGAATLRGLLKIFHTEDPTRPVTVGCDQIASEPLEKRVRPEFLAELDIVGYNYADRWRNRAELYYSIDHAAFPQRRMIGTESVGMGGIRGEYREIAPQKGEDPVPWFRNPSNVRVDAEQLWQFVAVHDYVAGDFMWTGLDYLGESRWPMKSASSGALDTCGFPKDGFYFYQSQWTQKPMAHLMPHWNWKGREGTVIPVVCYTNCDTVELLLNGKSLGVKGYEFPRMGMEGKYGNFPERAKVLRTTADLHLSWDVPYEAGTLRAVGMKDGRVAVTEEVSTTGEAVALGISVDRSSIAADRRDVAHVTVSIVDAEGRVVPGADHEVSFALEGEGRLIGVDNGDPFSHASYKASTRRAFHGLCLAVVQSTANAGQIRIDASSPGLRSASLVVTTA
ncbi:MAG TPA: glycoside hydrolase family 2 TIM barrel-domain containing protein [Acidobacteriaceae bacterium]|jgi:beta-galactosidase|nr:glycoside hydrolase family 2 TIM barrel-domain containing protein [Acidobacteriaceae bacterium]